MGLKVGTFLGQYEVLALIGVGGMGEVYHAKDSKLNREVALKVLPEQFARDPERIGRLRREAQVLASLDHPNIARIYAFEESGSARFLVMELVPGETLRERIKRGSREWGVGNGEEQIQTGTNPRHKLRAVATPGGTGGFRWRRRWTFASRLPKAGARTRKAGRAPGPEASERRWCMNRPRLPR